MRAPNYLEPNIYSTVLKPLDKEDFKTFQTALIKRANQEARNSTIPVTLNRPQALTAFHLFDDQRLWFYKKYIKVAITLINRMVPPYDTGKIFDLMEDKCESIFKTTDGQKINKDLVSYCIYAIIDKAKLPDKIKSKLIKEIKHYLDFGSRRETLEILKLPTVQKFVSRGPTENKEKNFKICTGYTPLQYKATYAVKPFVAGRFLGSKHLYTSFIDGGGSKKCLNIYAIPVLPEEYRRTLGNIRLKSLPMDILPRSLFMNATLFEEFQLHNCAFSQMDFKGTQILINKDRVREGFEGKAFPVMKLKLSRCHKVTTLPNFPTPLLTSIKLIQCKKFTFFPPKLLKNNRVRKLIIHRVPRLEIDLTILKSFKLLKECAIDETTFSKLGGYSAVPTLQSALPKGCTFTVEHNITGEKVFEFTAH